MRPWRTLFARNKRICLFKKYEYLSYNHTSCHKKKKHHRVLEHLSFIYSIFQSDRSLSIKLSLYLHETTTKAHLLPSRKSAEKRQLLIRGQAHGFPGAGWLNLGRNCPEYLGRLGTIMTWIYWKYVWIIQQVERIMVICWTKIWIVQFLRKPLTIFDGKKACSKGGTAPSMSIRSNIPAFHLHARLEYINIHCLAMNRCEAWVMTCFSKLLLRAAADKGCTKSLCTVYWRHPR